MVAQRPIQLHGFRCMLHDVLPRFLCAESIWQQREAASTESLRPVGRSQFLKEIGLLYAYRTAVAWAVLNVGWCRAGICVCLRRARVESADVQFAGVVGSVPSVPLWPCSLGVAIGWSPSPLPHKHFSHLPSGDHLYRCGSHVIGVMYRWTRCTGLRRAVVAAGALITWDAYRRWMQTELG